MRDQAIERGIGGGTTPGDAVTEPIGPVGPVGPPPANEPGEPGGWRGALRDHLAFALVLIVGIVGIIRIVQYHWREGAALLGAALLLAALLRALLPDRRAGLLLVRGKAVDVLSYGALGVCVLFVALTITGGPFG